MLGVGAGGTGEELHATKGEIDASRYPRREPLNSIEVVLDWLRIRLRIVKKSEGGSL